MKRMQSLHSVHVNAVENKIDFVRKALDDVDIVKDQKLFVEYNIRPFTHPANLEFEPCEAFYEKARSRGSNAENTNSWKQAEFSAEPEPKVYLQNRLRIAREKVKEHAPLVAAKGKELRHPGSRSNVIQSTTLRS
jgi:formin-binding protein 1